ncbi:MAG: hypothetical protein J6D21_05595 [Clostridia bacterium]|nr:hypothetical protein [Clostridia bacterium]
MKYEIQPTEALKITGYDRVFALLPPSIRLETENVYRSLSGKRLHEIRLHRDAPIMLNVDGTNHLCGYRCTKEDISAAVNYLCGGSLYAHAETIKNGYIRCGGGIRAGICGKAVTEGGAVIGVSEITSINIRIPHRLPGADKVVLSLLQEENFLSGILIYSPPGVGKTTVLRELSYSLSNLVPPLRFAIIDTREEICPSAFFSGAFDLFSGYPQGVGIESATRTMAPQLILCDEIGNERDAQAILRAQSTGVPLVATAHAHTMEELQGKPFIAPLFAAKVFRYCVGIGRSQRHELYDHEVTKLW